MKQLIAICSICLLLMTCKSATEDYFSEWRKSTPYERGMNFKAKLIHDSILGKTREEVIALLGEPENKGSILTSRDNNSKLEQNDGVILPDNFLYDCGDMDGPYTWTFIICFDENGKVYRMGLDD